MDEMTKLRDGLTAKGIKWYDKSDDREDKYYICRTHFYVKGVRWSAIIGYGTYGSSTGLLELMTGHNDPEVLTAEQILNRL